MARRNLGQIRSTVNRRVGASTQIQTADLNGIIADVHRDIAVNAQWSFRRREAVVSTLAPYATGTLATTTGSPNLLGTGTAWTTALEGSAIAIAGENAYLFVGIVNTGLQQITLQDAQGVTFPWPGATASGRTYRIFRPQYSLPAGVAIVLGSTRSFKLREKTRAHFDGKDPMRQSQGEPVEYALVRSKIDTGPTEQNFIEFWPVPDSVYLFRIPYLIEPPDLVNDPDLPVCPSEPIEWRAAAEAAWFLLTKTGDARWDTLAKSYYTVYAGNEDQGVPGVLLQALRDDQHRFGLPQTLADGDTIIGNDLLSTRDWDLVGGGM